MGILIFAGVFLALVGLVGLFGFLGAWELLLVAAVAAVLTRLIVSRRASRRAGL